MTCRPKKRRTRWSIIINNITYNIAVAIPKTNAHLKSNIFPCCVSFSLLYLCGHLTKVACDKFKTLSVCQESIVNHSFISMSQARSIASSALIHQIWTFLPHFRLTSTPHLWTHPAQANCQEFLPSTHQSVPGPSFTVSFLLQKLHEWPQFQPQPERTSCVYERTMLVCSPAGQCSILRLG